MARSHIGRLLEKFLSEYRQKLGDDLLEGVGDNLQYCRGASDALKVVLAELSRIEKEE